MSADPPGSQRKIQVGVSTRRLVGGAAGYTVALVVTAAAGLINMRLGIDYLGTVQYSLLLLAGTISGWGVVGNLGLGSAVRQRVTSQLAKDEIEEAARTLSSGVASLAAIGGVLLGLFLILHFSGVTQVVLKSDALPDVDRAARLLLLGVLLFLMKFPFQPLGGLVVARNQLIAHNLFTIAYAGTRPLVLWVTLERTTDLETLMLVQAAHQWVDLILRYAFVLRELPELRIRPRLATLRTARSLVSPSVSYMIISMGMVVIYASDNAVIGAVLAVESIAGYAAAFRLFSILRQICVSGIEVLSPAAAILDARGEGKRLSGYVLMGSRMALALGVLAGGGLAFLGPPLIEVWLPGLDDPPTPGTLLALGLLLPIGVYINGIGRAVTGVARHHRQAMIFLVEMALNVGLSIYLAKRHGIVGVALGTLFSRLIVAPLYTIDSVRTLGLPFRGLLTQVLFPGAALGAVLWTASRFVRIPENPELPELLLWLGGYSALCLAAISVFVPRAAWSKVRARFRGRGPGAGPGASS